MEGTLLQVLNREAAWCVLCGDALVRLKELPDCSVDSTVVDVPYGLGTREPTVEEIVAYLTGASDLNTGGDFMGKKWQVPSVAIWREVYRVMRPGAHLCCFGGTRTWDLISLGIRAAGFQMRDTIATYSAGLSWIQGAGFPKSLSISKAIDKASGAEREVVGPVVYADGTPGHWSASEKFAQDEHTKGLDGASKVQTAPSTDDAKKWDGFGTALKPSHEDLICAVKPIMEPCFLARKPLDGTIVQTVLKHGTGALNIDACRIGTDWSDRSDSWKASGHSAKPEADKIAAPPGSGINCHELGRWPTNAVLIHADGCQVVGEETTELSRNTGFGDELQSPGSGWGTKKPTTTTTTTCKVWACVDGCPVKELAIQSGESTSGSGSGSGGIWSPSTGKPAGPQHGDSGSSARFFPQFQHSELDAPFFYTSKSSRRERDQGLGHLKRHTGGELCNREEGSAGLGPRAGAGRTSGGHNDHSTVKPVALIEWLQKLTTPPGGVTLDFTCGSGTAGVSATLNGFRFIGIDIDPHFAELSRERIANAFPLMARMKPEAKPEKAPETEAEQTKLFG